MKLHQWRYFSVIFSLPGSSPSSAKIMKSCTSHAVKAGCTCGFPFPGLMPFPHMPVEDVVPLEDRSSNSFVFCSPAIRRDPDLRLLNLVSSLNTKPGKKFWIRPTREWWKTCIIIYIFKICTFILTMQVIKSMLKFRAFTVWTLLLWGHNTHLKKC